MGVRVGLPLHRSGTATLGIWPSFLRASNGLRSVEGPLVVAVRSELFPRLRAAGFTLLRVTGVWLSGARPGRIVMVDLERQP